MVMAVRPSVVDGTAVAHKTLKKKGMGAIPDGADKRDYEYKALVSAGRFQELPDMVSVANLLPKETWDQGDTSACTAFTTAALVAAARAKAGLKYFRPSVAATWYWTKAAMYGEKLASQNLGCSIREAILSTRREGVVAEADFPFFTKSPVAAPSPDLLLKAEANQSLYFFRLDDPEVGAGLDLNFLFRCLAEGWPVSITLPIHKNFEPDFATSRIPMPDGGLEGYHAMTIYGYFLNGKEPFIRVRNSWGNWGGRHILPSGKQIEAGTCRIPLEYVEKHGFDCWTIRAVEDGMVCGNNVPLVEVTNVG